MAYQLEIPEEELQYFQSFLQIFTKGKVIVQEGHTRDQRIFLLRQGEVEVAKKIGEHQQVIGKIQAVNFFGEMALISHRPRTATIIAASDPVVVYAFDNPNLSHILAHPKWSLMLVRRLTENLEQRHNEFEAIQVQYKRVEAQISEMVGALLTLYAQAGNDEHAKQMFLEALPKLIKFHFNDMDIKLAIPDEDRLKVYRRLNIIPDHLYHLAMNTRSKLKK